MSGVYEDALRRLATMYGVTLKYQRASRERPWVHATEEQLQLHLGARDIPCSTLDQVGASIGIRRAELLGRWVQPVYSGGVTDVMPLEVLVPHGMRRFEVVPVTGGTSNGDLTCLAEHAEVGPDGLSYDRCQLPLGGMNAFGFHDLTVRISGGVNTPEREFRSRVIVGPDRFWSPPGDQRYYGVTAMLSSLSATGYKYLGRGNTYAAREAAKYLAGYGANFLAVGPMQLFDWPFDVPGGSPFMPLATGLLTHHCLDALGMAEKLQLFDTVSSMSEPAIQAMLTRLRLSRRVELLEYDRLLYDLLKRMYAEFKFKHINNATNEATQFREFVAAGGDDLRLPAMFLALREHFFPEGSSSQMWNFDNWPEDFQQPGSSAVRAFCDAHPDQVELIMFIQWIVHADTQQLRSDCKTAGMKLGLWTNIPVGLSAAPADKWVNPGQFLRRLRMGCPPDPLAEGGQSWGYPVRDPDALLLAGLEPVLVPVRMLMRSFDGAEKDHGMADERTFVYPTGADASVGVYLQFPFEHLLRAYMLLSHQHEFIVAPELVGTKSETIDGRMEAAGALSLTQQRYTRDPENRLLKPELYPPNGIVFGGGHNHFPDIGWLCGIDIDYGVRYRNDAPADAENARKMRAGDVPELLAMLGQYGLLSATDIEALLLFAATPIADEDLLYYASESPLLKRFLVAVHRLRSKAACRYMAVELMEALGAHPSAPNMPGETPTYRGWQEKALPVSRWDNTPLPDVLIAIRSENR